MKLSKRIRKWKANLTTQTPVEYVITLRADVNGFADEVKVLESENAKLRKLVRMMWLACKSKDIVGGIYTYPDKNSNADEQILFEPLLRELGVEVYR